MNLEGITFLDFNMKASNTYECQIWACVNFLVWGKVVCVRGLDSSGDPKSDELRKGGCLRLDRCIQDC